MGTITRSFTAVTGATILAADIETDLDAVFDEFNGSIEAANIAAGAVGTTQLAATSVTAAKLASSSVLEAKIDYTSANSGPLVARVGPSYAGANGGRLAFVQKAVTTTAATAETITVTFSSDCADGDPAFTAAPVIVGRPAFVKNDTDATLVPNQCWILAVTSTQATVRIVRTDNTAQSMSMEFALWGPI